VNGTGVLDRLTALFDMAELTALVVLVVVILAVRATSRHWSTRRRRAFWCALAAHDVEAEFEEWGLPGLRHSVVTRCSAFEPPEAITCERRCRDVSFRRLSVSTSPMPGLPRP
jgi:hypothetical protein